MKILFASMPFDGHFNPLTGIAAHLLGKGHDVRWYTGPGYAKKLGELGIRHYPFDRAKDVNAINLPELFPEYDKLGGGPKAIEFAATKIFFANIEAHFQDITALHAEFAFDAFISDGAFYAARLVAEKIQPNVYVISPAPTPAPVSKTSPPPFFGLKPAKTLLGRVRDRAVTAMLDSSMKPGRKIFDDVRARASLPPYRGSIFDIHNDTARAWFQIGAPGMDYPRSDRPANFRFVGALLPAKRQHARGSLPYSGKLEKYGSLVAVSQGTVDNRDPEKLFVPALEALKGGPHLVVVATGGRHTEALKARFPEDNVVVADWIDFDPLMDDADLFVCNGGFGSIMHALAKGVPILSAGKLEGKSDINARLDFCGLGLDLDTERPTPNQIARGVAKVLGDRGYVERVGRLKAELETYRPFEIIEQAVVRV